MAQCAVGKDWPCGQCLVCRINKSRVWTARLMLEATQHEYSSFQTFTYETTPVNGSLDRTHLASSFHRLRDLARTRGRTVRFYGVGEYGGQSGRPHYHAAVFGLLPEHQPLIEKAWSSVPGAGHIDVPSQLEPQSAAYICGYVTKKHADDEFRAAGLEPQFSLMSRNPGIGLVWLPVLVETLSTPDGVRYMVANGDVPSSVKCGSRTLPLGSYMRQKLRFHFYGDHTQPYEAASARGLKHHAEVLQEMPPLPVDAKSIELIEAWFKAQSTVRDRDLRRRAQRALQISTRKKIFDQMRTL